MGSGDGVLRFRDGIAITQVVLFSLSFMLAYHFRWTRRIGWFCIGSFSILRLVGAGCMLGTVKRDSDSLWAGIFVCESLGIFLLIFTMLQMMERMNDVIPIVSKRVWIIPQILTTIDIGISIGGFVVVARKDKDQLLPTPYSRAGIALLAVIFLYTVGISLYLWVHRRHYAPEESRLLKCVGVCAPLLLVRVLYSVIFVITGNMTWQASKGSPAAYFLMTMLPEVGFIAACSVTIKTTRPIVKNEGDAKNERG